MASAGLAVSATCLFPRRTRADAGKSPIQATPDIQSLIDQERQNILAAMAKEDIPGAGICLITEGRPVWIEGFGFTDRHSNHKVSDSTIFNVESTSKNFTATAVMIAVQRGILDLDEPISTYLPDFTVHSRFEVVPEKKITLRLLLSHRAGFTHEAPVGNNYDPDFPDFEAHIRSISTTWLRYPVGERYRYSNLGFDLAGYILQTVSKMPFAEFLKTMLFDPLGMADSTAATEVYTRRVDRAVGHQAGYTAVPLRIPLIPSGGVYTSPRDIAAYLIFHLNQGKFKSKTILEPTLWREMHSFSLGGNYGLGVARSDLRFGETSVRLLNHNGSGYGFGCAMDYLPEAQVARAAFFSQDLAPNGDQFGVGPEEALLTRRYGARKPRLTANDLAVIEPDGKQLERFVGTYVGRVIPSAVQMRIENGKLGLQLGPVFSPMQFTSPVDVFSTAPTGDVVTSRYFPATDDEAAHFECSIGDFSFDYNDGPHDPFGPNKPAWEAFLGQYQVTAWGQPAEKMTVHRKNGYLYVDDYRLSVEVEPGLFFTCDGEAIDFRHPVPTWKNIRLQRVAALAEPSP